MRRSLLDVTGLSKRFGGFTAIDGIDMSIECGERRCIIGPNGAGKSTFLSLVMGVCLPTRGAIHYNGEDISVIPIHRRIIKGLGIKFQIPGVFPELSVSQNLAIALQRCTPNHNLVGEIDRLVELLGLHQQRATLALNLSHGQKQWLDIGMAVGSRPVLLLLDEPTAGMSPEETFKTGELVQRLNDDGITIVAIEHDMAFVRQIATKVTVLNYGRIFCEGSIDEIENDREVAEIYLGNV